MQLDDTRRHASEGPGVKVLARRYVMHWTTPDVTSTFLTVFISGYGGSPLGGYDIELTEAGTFQGEDETRRRSSRRSPPNSNSYGCPYKFF